tara:strand:- start:778 stop:1311 length:534 start_codon:yes stop_codon:yes gene_type:complete
MKKDDFKIAQKTLQILRKKSWNNIKIKDVYQNQNKFKIKNKNDLLISINKYFDYLLKKNLPTIEKSSAQDMLFEVLMARFDILNIHRKSIINIINHIKSKPHDFISLIPTFLESMILILSLANINVNGIKGAAKIKGVFVLYIMTSFTWSKDETSSLEKTMTTLDNYLTQINKFKIL